MNRHALVPMHDVPLFAFHGLAVAVVIGLLAWKFPSGEPLHDGPPLAELQKEFAKWDIAFALLLIALMVPLAFAFFLPLHALAVLVAEARRSDLPRETFVFFSDTALGLPALFAAIGVGSYPALAILRRILGDRFRGYERMTALRYTMDPHRATAALASVVLVVSLVATLGLFQTCVVASPSEIHVRDFFGAERQYEYDDIESVKTSSAMRTPKGGVVEGRFFVVRFRDGETIQSWRELESEIEGRSAWALYRAIVSRSGVAPVSVEVLESEDLE